MAKLFHNQYSTLATLSAFFLIFSFLPADGMIITNYTQPLNHFGAHGQYGKLTFQQRYVINDKYAGGAENNTPILVFFGGEQRIMSYVGHMGVMIEAASRFRALKVYIEHRFYGTSVPFGSIDKAFAIPEVRNFLTSEQALADFASIITSLKKNLSAIHLPVIVLGVSYGGMLATWFRIKYPKIAIGALASWAPLLLFDNFLANNDFCSITSKDFETVNKSCFNTIRRSWNTIDEIASEEFGLGVLTKTFNLCRALEGIAALIADLGVNNQGCVPVNVSGVTGYNPYDDDSKAWNWQLCREIIIYESCKENNSMLIPRETIDDQNEHMKNCLKRYATLPCPNLVSTFHDGLDAIKGGSNIIFSNGLMDPYSSLGILEDLSSTIRALNTKEGSCCLDMYPSRYDDPRWLVDQRNKEIDILKGWIHSGASKIPTTAIFLFTLLLLVDFF